MRLHERRFPLPLSLPLFLILSSATPARGAPPHRTGTLSVQSSPKAQVFLDGQSIGITPVKQVLRPGSYKVELRTFRGRSTYRDVVIRADKRVSLVYRFTPVRRGGTGTLEVHSHPFSQVFLDGRAVGDTPLRGYRLAGRSYNLELRTSNGQSYKRIVYVERGKTARVFHTFPKPGAPAASGPSGWLRVNSTPPAVVFVDGKRAGHTPLVDYDVRVGAHVVKLVAADKRTHQRTVHIGRDKTTQFVYRFPPKTAAEDRPHYGCIRIASNRPAEIFIDGKEVGFTPLIDYQLRPGLHRVVLKRRKRRKHYRIRIRAGYTRTISARFYR